MTGLTLLAASAVLDPPGPGTPPSESIMDFQRALVEPFGRKVDEDLFRRGAQVSHTDLIDRLLDADDVRKSRPQLVVVTHALPDVTPFTAVAAYLANRLDCDTQCFGIAQQGLAAPFTALRIAAAFHRAGRCTEAVITALEQTTLPTAMPLVDETPLKDSAAALVLGQGPGPQLAEVVSGGDVTELIRDRVTGGELVVLGPWVDTGELGDVQVHRVGPGSYCTSVWLALATHWRAWQAEHSTILLCDTDPITGRGHVAVFARNRRNDR
ncbi:hypothetical protein [Actinocrispum wychmicini]|uniref:Uncharacterized protein n=1 Tax=Actinocrispum wychmicini TaxID=1213861 RepID=A0A4R2IJJ6_9PSEU|nr:hypothetical protein [Actinocrispum wychmicini]TCO44777.1 hypothetical protein EV192_12234 [Actinocrispum wychmicini]